MRDFVPTILTTEFGTHIIQGAMGLIVGILLARGLTPPRFRLMIGAVFNRITRLQFLRRHTAGVHGNGHGATAGKS